MTDTTTKHEPLIVAEANTPEWYAARLTGIGSSEIAAAAGLSRYSTPFEIYCRKRGLLDEKPDNDAMRLGRLLEPVLKSEFTHRTGLQLTQETMPMLRHPLYPQVIDTPDGMVSDGNPFEGKTCTWRMAKELGDTGTDEVPAEWLCQLSWHMFVTNTPQAHLAVLVDGRTLRTYVIDRHPELLALLLKAALELWERIVNADPPEPTWEAEGTLETLKHLHGVAEGKAIDLSPEAAIAWAESRELAKQMKELETRQDALKARVLFEMEDAAIGRMPGTKEIVRTIIPGSTYMTVKQEHSRIYERKVRGE